MIYLIITTSLLNKWGITDLTHRLKNYKDSVLNTLNNCPSEIKPIIVENNGMTESFLEKYKVPVLYTSNNHRNLSKADTELADIHDVIKKYDIQDDDIVIKITGRYHVNDDSFFKFVIEEQNNYDAFVKFFNVCKLEYMERDCVLGLFAIKCKYLKEFRYINNSSAEVQFATYIRENISKLYEVKPGNKLDKLNMTCCFAGDLRILNV